MPGRNSRQYGTQTHREYIHNYIAVKLYNYVYSLNNMPKMGAISNEGLEI